jgi:hypothetical protein
MAQHPVLVLCLVCALGTQAFATTAKAQAPTSACAVPTTETAATLFERRATAIRDAHPDRLLRLYAANAVIETPLAPQPLHDRDTQRAFLVEYLARDVTFVIVERTSSATCDRITDRGLATITSRINHRTTTTASYTVAFYLAYVRDGSDWRILHDRTALALKADEQTPELVGPSRPAAVAGYVKRAPDARAQSAPPTAVAVVRPARARPQTARKAQPASVQRKSVPPPRPSAPAVQPSSPRPSIPRNETLTRPLNTIQRASFGAMELPRQHWTIPVALR